MVQTIKDQEYIEFVDESNCMVKFSELLDTVHNVALVGQTGTGKTILVHTYVKQHGIEDLFYEKTLSSETTKWDLVASDVLEGGTSKIRAGIITRWLLDVRPGYKLLYLDGWNYLRSDVKNIIEELADWRGSIYVDENNQKLRRTTDHKLVISFNPAERAGAYTGTIMDNIAHLRRFEHLQMTYLSVMAELGILKHFDKDYKWVRMLVEFANATRINYMNGEIRLPITTGNLINYCKLHQRGKLTEDEIIQIAIGVYPEEERPGVYKLWNPKK